MRVWHFRHRAERSPPSEMRRKSGRSFHEIVHAPPSRSPGGTEPSHSIKTLCGPGNGASQQRFNARPDRCPRSCSPAS